MQDKIEQFVNETHLNEPGLFDSSWNATHLNETYLNMTFLEVAVEIVSLKNDLEDVKQSVLLIRQDLKLQR